MQSSIYSNFIVKYKLGLIVVNKKQKYIKNKFRFIYLLNIIFYLLFIIFYLPKLSYLNKY